MGMDDYGKKIKKVGFWQVKGKGAVCMWTGSVVVFKKRKREEGGMKRKRHDSKRRNGAVTPWGVRVHVARRYKAERTSEADFF